MAALAHHPPSTKPGRRLRPFPAHNQLWLRRRPSPKRFAPKLTPDDALFISAQARAGLGPTEVHRTHYPHLSLATVRDVMQGRSWSHLTGLTPGNGVQKLTYKIACEVKLALSRGERYADIRRRFGLNTGALNGIYQLRTWRYALLGLNPAIQARLKAARAKRRQSLKSIPGVTTQEEKRIKAARARRKRRIARGLPVREKRGLKTVLL